MNPRKITGTERSNPTGAGVPGGIKKQRKDYVTEAMVEEGLSILREQGMKPALQFMLDAKVPKRVINRVLLQPLQRRTVLNSALRMITVRMEPTRGGYDDFPRTYNPRPQEATKPSEDDNEQTLGLVAAVWLTRLPADARPTGLIDKFPRIVNRIAALWPTPLACDRYMISLLVDTRGGRQGFPAPVCAEIMRLQSLNAERMPPPPAPETYSFA